MKLAIAFDEANPPSDRPRPSKPQTPNQRARAWEGDRQWWLGATDFGRRALTIAAVAEPALRLRWRDAAGAGLSLVVAHQLCRASKHLIPEERPDGGDDKSFPSAHAIDTFSSATSMCLSSGASLGLPAFAGAAWVAYGRLRAERHHARDVLVGAAVGSASAWLARRLVDAVARRYSIG